MLKTKKTLFGCLLGATIFFTNVVLSKEVSFNDQAVADTTEEASVVENNDIDGSQADAFLGRLKCAAGVELYRDHNHKKYVTCLTFGNYNLGALKRKGVKNDDISSLRITQGVKVIIYEHNHFRGRSKEMTASSWHNLNGHFHDSVTSIRVKRETQQELYPFTVGVISDTQFYRVSENTSKNKKQSLKLNKVTSNLIRRLGLSTLIINGDLTEFGHSGEEGSFDNFISDIGYKNNINIYMGLGNHDYGNNIGDCQRTTFNKDECAWQMVKKIRSHVASTSSITDYDFNGSTNRGSLSYSWDIGNVHFIQLHNFLGYNVKIGSTIFRRDVSILSGVPWLEKNLKAARVAGKRIFINVHDYGSSKVKLKPLLVKYKVEAVFAGHIHTKLGLDSNYKGTDIYYSGASFYNNLLVVKFSKNSFSVKSYNSARKISSQYDTGQCLGLSAGAVNLQGCYEGDDQWRVDADGRIRALMDLTQCLQPVSPYDIGSKIEVSDCRDSDYEYWVRNSNGSISPKFRPSMCLEVAKFGGDSTLSLQKCNGHIPQSWGYDSEVKETDSNGARLEY